MVRVGLMLALLTGCDGLFHILEVPGVDARHADATADTTSDTSADAAGNCYVEMFSGTTGDLAPHWTVASDPGAHASVIGGALNLESDANVLGYSWALARDHMSFVGNVASVEIAKVNGSGDEETLFELYIDDYNFYLIQYYQGRIYMEVRLAGTNMDEQDVPYEAVSQRFWGFRYNANGPKIDCMTSPDGSDWTVLDQLSVVVPIDDIRTQLLAGTFTTGPATAQTAVYDNYSRCTP